MSKFWPCFNRTELKKYRKRKVLSSMQSGPFPPRINRIGTEEEEGRPGVGVAIEGRASAVAARPSLANDPFPSCAVPLAIQKVCNSRE